jgi:hypothetical protein
MDNDLVLYRTFIPLSRLDRLRLSRPAGSRDPLVTEIAPLRDLLLHKKGVSSQGFYYN